MESNFTFSVLVQNLDCKQVPTAHWKSEIGNRGKLEETLREERETSLPVIISKEIFSN